MSRKKECISQDAVKYAKPPVPVKREVIAKKVSSSVHVKKLSKPQGEKLFTVDSTNILRTPKDKSLPMTKNRVPISLEAVKRVMSAEAIKQGGTIPKRSHVGRMQAALAKQQSKNLAPQPLVNGPSVDPQPQKVNPLTLQVKRHDKPVSVTTVRDDTCKARGKNLRST